MRSRSLWLVLLFTLIATAPNLSATGAPQGRTLRVRCYDAVIKALDSRAALLTSGLIVAGVAGNAIWAAFPDAQPQEVEVETLPLPDISWEMLVVKSDSAAEVKDQFPGSIVVDHHIFVGVVGFGSAFPKMQSVPRPYWNRFYHKAAWQQPLAAQNSVDYSYVSASNLKKRDGSSVTQIGFYHVRPGSIVAVPDNHWGFSYGSPQIFGDGNVPSLEKAIAAAKRSSAALKLFADQEIAADSVTAGGMPFYSSSDQHAKPHQYLVWFSSPMLGNPNEPFVNGLFIVTFDPKNGTTEVRKLVREILGNIG